MTEVAPSVHRLEFAIGGKPMAMHLLNGDSVILIDTGIPDTPEQIYLPALSALGRSPADVELVVITHADADHIGGNSEALRLFPRARLACHPLDKRWASDPAILTEERYDGFLEFGLRYDPDVFALLVSWMGPAVSVDGELDDGATIAVSNGNVLTVHHVPGHTPGHILLHNSIHGYALIGDAIFGRTQLDTAGGKAAAPPYTDVMAYRGTIEKIRALDVDLLLTCHYPIMRGKAVRQFVDYSLEWSERAEIGVGELLATSAEPVTLGDAIDRLDPVLGPFAAPRELQWSLLAHFEYAVHQGQAHRTTIDEIVAWESNDR
jgi:glyoxylase-like metal-dependent hydrolase (beta-lactamase superfamily II)